MHQHRLPPPPNSPLPPPSKHTAPCVLHPGHAVCLLQVTSDSWQLLHSWYGGGPSITRTAVMEGLAPNSKRARVMLYPMKLEVCWGGKVDEVKTIEVEKHVSGAAAMRGPCVGVQWAAACATCAVHCVLNMRHACGPPRWWP